MAIKPQGLGELENFRVSRTIEAVLHSAAAYAASGSLGVEEFFRGAVDYGHHAESTSAAFLYRALRDSAAQEAFESAFPPPTPSSESDVLNVNPELTDAFRYAASVRTRTGGKDDFLGLRHILFSLATLPGAIPSLNRILLPMGRDAAWLATQLRLFIQDSLEPGERWQDWLRVIDDQTAEPVDANQSPDTVSDKAPGSGPDFTGDRFSKSGASSDAAPPPSTGVPFDLVQAPLSDGARYILSSAGQRVFPNGSLSTTLVMIELVERGKPRAGNAYWSADFLHREVAPLGAAYETIRNEYWSRLGQPNRDAPMPRNVTPGLGYVLTRAQDLAEQTTGDRTVFARHLLAAVISEPPAPHRLGAAIRLEELGLNLPLLREHLFDWLRGYGDNDDAWRVYLLGPKPQPQRLTAFDADDTHGPDLLDVQRDVTALATLIAATSLAPPLSIGLFGDWGSGKTFFMRRLQAMVAQLSQDARDSARRQREVPFYKHIVQIEFNAWHYVEGNLWASLVEHIFRHLRQTDASTRASVEAMQKHWIEQLGFKETAVAQATERANAAANQIAAADHKVESLKKEHEAKTEELQRLSARSVARDFTLGGVPGKIKKALEPLGLAPASAAVNDLESSLRQARAILERGNSLVSALIRIKGWKRWASVSIILFSGPAAVGLVDLILKQLGKDAISQISSFMTWATATLTVAAGWLRKQGRWLSTRLDELEEANRAYDTALAEQQAETAKLIAQTEQELALARQEYATAQQAAEQARREHEAIQKELANITPGQLLGRFIEDRAASSDYRKHLGVLAVIRDDFQELSRLIEQENERISKLTSLLDEGPNEDKRVNRIVLYIDDLDRCPPNKVIDVLQAVHLLLAFPLFVVVVGVDARWVARSLETRYRELLHVDGADSPLRGDIFGVARSDDYLEKIFQIPLWLRPLTPTGVRRMMQALLRINRVTPPQPPLALAAATPAAAHIETADTSAPGLPGGREDRPTTSAPKETAGGQSPAPDTLPAAEPKPEVRPTVNIESLEIRDFEIDVIDELSPLLGRSPRALKRFVNVYRLIKAGLTPAELSGFVKPNPSGLSSYEAVLLLLAIDTGFPRVSRTIFDYLRRQAEQREAQSPDDRESVDASIGPLLQALDTALGESPDWHKLRAWIHARQESTKLANSVQQLMIWVPQVSRYSFQAAQSD